MNIEASITLTRIDADRNMYRYYVMSLQPDLFGGCQLVRHWGRLGSKGQQIRQYFEEHTEASARLGQLEQAKRKKGYL